MKIISDEAMRVCFRDILFVDLVFSLFHRPDEISATEISSRLNGRAIPKSSHLTGQVGQAGQD